MGMPELFSHACRVLVVVCSIVFVSPAFSGQIEAVCSNESPQSYIDDKGVLTGISVDFVYEILSRLGQKQKISVYPWARVYSAAQRVPGVVAFTMTRTQERESKFHWISPVTRNIWALYGLEDKPLASLEEAKKVGAIGVMRKDARFEHLKKLGFTNLEDVDSHQNNIRKLLAGRVDLVYIAPTVLGPVCRELGVDIDVFKRVYTTKQVDAYVVMSHQTSEADVALWRSTAEQVKADGTFGEICRKWVKTLKAEFGNETHCTADNVLSLYPPVTQ